MRAERDNIFTVRLSSDDWQDRFSAWLCPALDIPTVVIKEAYDRRGNSLGLDSLRIDKGPARVRWTGAGEAPDEVTLGLVVAQQLSPMSEERFWKGIALVIPIITALIGVWGGWLIKAGSQTVPGPALTHRMWFRVDPNDLKDSGMPPAKITINNQEIKQTEPYIVESNATAIVDVTEAYRLFSRTTNIVSDSVQKIDALFPVLNNLNAQVTGLLCPGGAHGVPAASAEEMGRKALSISDALRDIRSELGGAAKR